MKEMKTALLKWLYSKLDEPTCRLLNKATFDLWYGPVGIEAEDDEDEPYPGFETATDRIIDVLDEWAGTTLWYNTGYGGLLETEPEGELIEGEDGEEDEWIEPYWPEFRRIDWPEILTITTGELSPYLQ